MKNTSNINAKASVTESQLVFLYRFCKSVNITVQIDKLTEIILCNISSVTVFYFCCLGGLGENTFYVDYRTEDGSANAGSDYEYTEGTLVFKPGETCKEIKVSSGKTAKRR